MTHVSIRRRQSPLTLCLLLVASASVQRTTPQFAHAFSVGVRTHNDRIGIQSSPSSSSSSSSSRGNFVCYLQSNNDDMLFFATEFQDKPSETITTTGAKEGDDEFPYRFTGRLWFCPAIVKTPIKEDSSLQQTPVSLLGAFGYTLGGTVALEYDSSPIGPYREYVTMSSLVGGIRSSSNGDNNDSNDKQLGWGTMGQWGSSLYVSTREAKEVCEDLWGVPAIQADIDFEEGNSNNKDRLQVTRPPNEATIQSRSSSEKPSICVSGWKNTRILESTSSSSQQQGEETQRWGRIPILWTPTIKALWAALPIPVLFGGDNENDNVDGKDDSTAASSLPIYKLRLSASAIRLRWSGFQARLPPAESSCGGGNDKNNDLGVPLGFGLVVDNVLIEIGNECASIVQK